MTTGSHPAPESQRTTTDLNEQDSAGTRIDPTITLLALLTPAMLLGSLAVARSVPADAPIPAAIGTIDPNTATWAELATLPTIGEVKAKAIVAYRRSFRQTAVAGPAGERRAFTCPADLDAVRGIGPKTVERVAPHLRFD